MLKATINYARTNAYSFFPVLGFETASKNTDFSLKMPVMPYSFNALEPFMDSLSLRNHFYNFHISGYVKMLELMNTNGENFNMEQLISNIEDTSDERLNYAGSILNHQLYWENLSPYGGEISGDFRRAIERDFGSVSSFKLELLSRALRFSANGWIWLIMDYRQVLRVVTTPNNINPEMKASRDKGTPLMAIDLWDHAFIHNSQSDKKDYLKKILLIINWEEVSNRYHNAL